MEDKIEYVIKVHNANISKAVQRHAFALGYGWLHTTVPKEIQNTEAALLFMQEGEDIYYL